MSKTVLFMGDSITECQRDKEDANSLGAGYAAMAAAALGSSEPGKYTFFNRGIGGDSVCNLLARMETDLLPCKPDYMSILVGVNDTVLNYFDHDKLRIDKFEKVYSLLIEECLDEIPGLKLMILTPYLLPHEQLNKTYEKATKPFTVEKLCDTVRTFADAATRVAKAHSIPYVNLQEKFDEALKLAPAEYWTKDGCHPTVMGHGLIAREWLKLFEEIR